ncbi:hypothetical protein LKM01_19150 [Bacillus pacificus]|nr:hypothetical protein [Bacillus pacificus]MCC2372063.1 hypothetical protein [Bacillus paranthracis]MRC70196.1 hypothetical protein [Bacillus thuringiensis]TNP21006.1 hypothetical protein FH036_26090 [Bacillus sp. CD3-5]MCC2389062.1 hypothetical protein [Bacillus pacificus]
MTDYLERRGWWYEVK